jgi:hypothetical protein
MLAVAAEKVPGAVPYAAIGNSEAREEGPTAIYDDVAGHESEPRAVGRSVGPSRGTATRIMDPLEWAGNSRPQPRDWEGKKSIRRINQKLSTVGEWRPGVPWSKITARRGKNNRLGGSLFVPVERISPLRPTTTTKN